jgi:tetratricopeptide (TPR) repeat protein
MSRVPVAIALTAAFSCSAAASAPSLGSSLPAPADGLIRSGLKDLHDGLYRKAEERFRAAARSAPGDPAPALFIAFAYWWRSLQDRTDRSLDDPFLAAVEEVVEAGERRLEADPDDLRVLTCVGTAHILRSQVEGMRRNFFKATQEARRGKKTLEAALKIDASSADVLFGLGAYNYYTEKIPGLARGLLFMPRGDAALGLRQLNTVASSDTYFSTDARLLLALICGSRDEQCYGDALAHLTTALEKNPKSPLILGSIGGLKMRLGFYPEAVRALEEALDAAAGDDPERATQRRILRIYLAEALAADWRLERALEAVREVGDPATLPERERHAFERISAEISQRQGLGNGTGDAQVASSGGAGGGRLADRVRAALAAQDAGREAEAFRLLRAASEAFPGDPLPPFLLGRLHFEQRRFAGAERELAEAGRRAENPPAWMAGWIELYRGLALSAQGHRDAAQAHFRAASEIKRFRSAERGLIELQAGAPPHGRCRS